MLFSQIITYTPIMKENLQRANKVENQERMAEPDIEELKKRTKKLFGEEWKKEGFPEVSIDILYASHGSAEDVAGTEDHFKNSDIYIPEVFGWDESYLHIYRSLSEGEISPEQVLVGPAENGRFLKQEEAEKVLEKALAESDPMKRMELEQFQSRLDMLYESHKSIIFIDLPDGHPLQKLTNTEEYTTLEFNKNFGSVLEKISKELQEDARLNKLREEYMAEQLEPNLKFAIEHYYPKLKDQETIKVLITLGAFHTGLIHLLKEKSVEAKMHLSNSPFIFEYINEATRRYRMGKEVDQELLAKVFLEKILLASTVPQLVKITSSSDKIYRFSRKLVSRFSYGDIKAINDFFVEHNKFPFHMLEEKNIGIPENEKELDDFLGIDSEKEL